MKLDKSRSKYEKFNSVLSEINEFAIWVVSFIFFPFYYTGWHTRHNFAVHPKRWHLERTALLARDAWGAHGKPERIGRTLPDGHQQERRGHRPVYQSVIYQFKVLTLFRINWSESLWLKLRSVVKDCIFLYTSSVLTNSNQT